MDAGDVDLIGGWLFSRQHHTARQVARWEFVRFKCWFQASRHLFPPSPLLHKMDPSQRWKTPLSPSLSLPLSLSHTITLVKNWVSVRFFFFLFSCLRALGYTFTDSLCVSRGGHILKGDSRPHYNCRVTDASFMQG